MTNYIAEYKVALPEGRQGPWAVEHFTVENGIQLWRIRLSGRYAPTPGETYTRLVHDKQPDPIMSDTPSEVRDHLEAIWEIEHRGGRILINGLGLGMVLQAALSFKSVTHIDVVELDQDVIDLVGPHYQDPRLVIHQHDALTMTWPKDTPRWNVAWHDIWPSICADHLPQIHRLHRMYGRRTEWQGSWCRREMERSLNSYH